MAAVTDEEPDAAVELSSASESPMSNMAIPTLLRTAALAALLVGSALAGCSADGSRLTMTGSVLPSGAPSSSAAIGRR